MNREPSAGLSEKVMSSRFRVGGGRVGQQQCISGSPGESVEQEQAGVRVLGSQSRGLGMEKDSLRQGNSLCEPQNHNSKTANQ